MRKVELTAENLFGYTKSGFKDEVQQFLKQAPELFKAKGPKNFTIAHYAVHSGLTEFFDIPQIVAYADAPADNGYLPIMEAAKFGYYRMVVKLVDLKDDASYWQVKTALGSTLLHLVALSRLDNLQTQNFVLRLFYQGLRLTDANKSNKTPLDYARWNKNPAHAVATLKELWNSYDQSEESGCANSDSDQDEAIDRSRLSLYRSQSCPALFARTTNEFSETERSIWLLAI